LAILLSQGSGRCFPGRFGGQFFAFFPSVPPPFYFPGPFNLFVFSQKITSLLMPLS
jgi:hypothetical protein